MSSIDQERIESLYVRAKALPPDERDAFLLRECGEASIRQQVELRLRDDSATMTLNLPSGHLLTLKVGELIAGRFRILRFLGQGGMGEVYEAADSQLGGSIALKVLRPNLRNDPQFLERFRREVQLARQVTHRNICRIFDVGTHPRDGEDLTFLTMEFLDGVTLSQLLRSRGRMTPDDAMPLVRQIAEGLAALHDKGIVHRDFKPGNVMVAAASDSGVQRAVIADFGLARAMSSDAGDDPESGPTQAGQIIGTPDYMAPEQLMGLDITQACDIYAFGMVLYEMVTGAKAYPSQSGRALENAVQRVSSLPEPPSRHARELPREWERTILLCLEREPSNRPSSAAAVVDGLSGLKLPGSRRNRGKWLGLSIAGAAIIAGAVIAPHYFKYSSGPAVPSRQHVAVLPFHVTGQDPELAVFADGLMEDITGRLSQFEGPNAKLLVVPASVVRQQSVKSAADAKSKLDSDSVIQGSLQSQGDRVRLLLTLIDTRQMRQIESVSAEDRRSNALSLEDAAVEKLANALNLHSRPEHAREARDQAPLAPGAYEYYLQARGYLQRNDKLSNIDSAISLFNRVLTIDRRSAIALSGLGEAYWAKFNLTRDTHWIDEALKSCRQALKLNPALPEAQITMGRIHLDTGNYDDAQKEFETALAGDSRSGAAIQGLAAAYEAEKHYDTAEATYRRAIALRQEDWNAYKQLALFYYHRGDFGKAITQAQRVVELTPDNAQGYTNLGAFQIRKGDTEAAKKSLSRALELDPNRVSTLTNLAKLYFDSEQYPDAIKLYERAVQVNGSDFRMPGALGIAYKRSGDDAKAAAPLQSAVQLVKAELRLNPKKAELYSYLALYEANLGMKGGIENLVHQAMTLAPDNIDITIRSAETQAIAGNKSSAIALIRKLALSGYPPDKLKASVPLRPLLTGFVH